MLNKEKYANEILDIVCQDGTIPAVVNNVPIKCKDVFCYDCKFYCNDDCINSFIKWANSEYKEREIDWSKVPVDTPIVAWNVSDIRNGIEQRRHFAYFKNNKIFAWNDGNTSYTVYDNKDNATGWDCAKIAKGVDCSEWYKD